MTHHGVSGLSSLSVKFTKSKQGRCIINDKLDEKDDITRDHKPPTSLTFCGCVKTDVVNGVEQEVIYSNFKVSASNVPDMNIAYRPTM